MGSTRPPGRLAHPITTFTVFCGSLRLKNYRKRIKPTVSKPSLYFVMEYTVQTVFEKDPFCRRAQAGIVYSDASLAPLYPSLGMFYVKIWGTLKYQKTSHHGNMCQTNFNYKTLVIASRKLLIPSLNVYKDSSSSINYNLPTKSHIVIAIRRELMTNILEFTLSETFDTPMAS